MQGDQVKKHMAQQGFADINIATCQVAPATTAPARAVSCSSRGSKARPGTVFHAEKRCAGTVPKGQNKPSICPFSSSRI